MTVVTTALLGAWPQLPEVLGLSFALLGAMLATGAWSSARFPYSIPQEGYKNVAPGQAGPRLDRHLRRDGLGGPALRPRDRPDDLAERERGRRPVDLAAAAAGGRRTGRWSRWLGLRLAAPRTARRLPEILAAVSKG